MDFLWKWFTVSPEQKLHKVRKQRKKLQNNVDHKCKKFCQDVYIPNFKQIDKKIQQQLQMNLQDKKIFRKQNKKERLSDCIRMHCNPQCNPDLFVYSIKHNKGWTDQFSKQEKQTLVKKGALSGCSKDPHFKIKK